MSTSDRAVCGHMTYLVLRVSCFDIKLCTHGKWDPRPDIL